MRVLVTGAAGVIGSATVRHLTAADVPVVALPGDATDEAGVGAALADCDAVVHLAALAHPSLGTPRRVFTNNVVATFTVLAQAAEHGVRRVVLASSVNAPGVAMNPHLPLPAYFPLDEDLPVDIADAYSLSKQVDETSAAMAARAWGMTVVALRFPLVRSRAELAGFAEKAAANPAEAMRTGWSYLTVDDAARAIMAALTAPLTGAHVVGLSAADTLLDVPTRELLDRYAPDVHCRQSVTGTAPLVDTTRARELLGFVPRESIHVEEP
ncbi:NAD-dependent epimerase/dehydratase family protein [Actinophytocola oryzae]|uniref:Nucleoside-diphosphate-sugar epimerase n=1 Tax=Actinophytocola oryzae TaxID=502181 RepID=A0A4R7W4M0_9PSEU|nr:NAD(P)-dependent oxidoreductase [Actinophytocola oryzae]TDV57653.1 nucleoside-diphosphate-sugar epimerase [Actinophytocola oryzae]